MTKGEAVDVIYLHVNGGKASSDNNIKRDEIAVYFPTALGVAIKGHIFELKQMAMAEKNSGDLLFENSLPEGFYTTFEGTPVNDTERMVYKLVLPKLIALPYGWAVRNPRAKKNPSADFMRLPNASITSAFESVFAGVYSYWTEDAESETTLFLNNLPAPICPMLVSIIKDPSDIEDDDKIDAPDDVINGAIRIATEYFRSTSNASRRHDDKGTKEGES